PPELIKASPPYIRRLTTEGRIKHYRVGRETRIHRTDALAFLYSDPAGASRARCVARSEGPCRRGCPPIHHCCRRNTSMQGWTTATGGGHITDEFAGDRCHGQ